MFFINLLLVQREVIAVITLLNLSTH